MCKGWPLLYSPNQMSNFKSRATRADSLESFDSDNQTNEAAEHGWRCDSRDIRKKSKTPRVVLSSYDSSQEDIDRSLQQSDTENGRQVDSVIAFVDEHIVDDETPILSSDDESAAIVYETDLPVTSESQNQRPRGFSEELNTPELKASEQKRETSSPSVTLPPVWRGGIAGKTCTIQTNDESLHESSDDESIQYEADMYYDTANEPLEYLGVPPPPPAALRVEKSESVSSEDEFESDEDNLALLKGRNAQCEARNFAMEHRIFIKCLMALLEQRDMVEVDMDDPNTIKCGPLKKATHLVKGAWKVKYVEIRRGVFSYYDDCLSKDAASEGDLVRKNVRLDAHTCVCRAVKLNHKSLTLVPGQAIFELSVDGSPRRFWMANSREERSAWIRAIHDAMVGGSITRDELQVDHVGRVGRVSRKSPYKRDLETYLKIQREVKNASNKHGYVWALSHIVGKPLNVPVKWISEQNHLTAEETELAFREDAVTTGVNQLWKDLARDTVQINGDLIKGGSGHAPERIVGAVTREIIRMDRSSPLRPDDPSFIWKGVTELQALSFARDILLSCNRTRSGGDSYYCVDALTNHPSMVVLVPSSSEAEPLSVIIEHYQPPQRTNSTTYSVHDRGGWLKTRTRQERRWKRLYFVLSEGTMSVYKKGHPRPYGLEAQIKVAETPMYVALVSLPRTQAAKSSDSETTTTRKSFILTIKGKEGIWERQILFPDENKFLIWAHALEKEIAKLETMDSPRRNLKFFQILSHRDEPSGAKDDARVGFVLGANSLEENAEALGFDRASISRRAMALALQYGGGTKVPTVNVSVRASTTYKICTLDPQGNESEDTWAIVHATFLQHFGIAGGPNGVMNRSEEVVQINVVECASYPAGGQTLTTDIGLSPRALAGTLTRKLRRKENQSDVTHPRLMRTETV